ncbi:pseudouridine synthase [Pilatotrama ljubarskyi]|nr:pseudouridine synthase [Pilatotrama ljubarskyi]
MLVKAHHALRRAAQRGVNHGDMSTRRNATRNVQTGQEGQARHPARLSSRPVNETTSVTPDDTKPANNRFKPEDLVLYEDRSLVAINKPNGLISQLSKPLNESLISPQIPVKDIQKFLNLEEDLRTVHRLDKPTTGVVLLAKNASVARELTVQMARNTMHKTYLALVLGRAFDFPQTEGVMKTTLVCRDGRVHCASPEEPLSLQEPHGTTGENWIREAVTEYRVLFTSPTVPLTLLSLNLVTGYKNQIRAQLAQHLHTPILSDHKYGDQKRTQEVARALKGHMAPWLYLHASRVTCFRYCRVYRPKRVNWAIAAPLPPAFLATCRAARIPLDVDQLKGGVWINGTKVCGVGSSPYTPQDGHEETDGAKTRGERIDVLQDLDGVWYGPTK